MSRWVLVLLGLMVAAAGMVLLYIQRLRKRQAALVRSLRSTELYGHLYPLLVRCDRRRVESIAVRPRELVIRVLLPERRKLVYTFDKHGFDPLSQENLYALAQAVAVDMPSLRSREDYHLATHTLVKANGEKQRWYEYMIDVRRKDAILRGHASQGHDHHA